MTYQKPSRNYDPAEESSSFRNVGAVSSSPFSSAVFGQDEADEEEFVVPVTVLEHNRTSKKFLMCVGILGMTAAVASSAMVLFTIMDYSNQDSTASSFLLHASVGADDDHCVQASGPWPTGSVSTDDDTHYLEHHPFVTCFVSTTGGYCWSHSYYNGDYWEACTPNGFDELMWSVHSPDPHDNNVFDDKSDDLPVETCGTPCTEFSQGLSR